MTEQLILSHCSIVFTEAFENNRKTAYFEFKSLDSEFPIRIYKSKFWSFYSSLGKCFSFIQNFKDTIETTDYLTFEIYQTPKNSVRLSVSGFVSEKGNTFLNVFLKTWYKPQDEDHFVCTRTCMKFDVNLDNLADVETFYRVNIKKINTKDGKQDN